MEHGKRYSKEEKMEILRFRETHTFQETSTKYGVSMMTLFRWNQRYRKTQPDKDDEVVKMDMDVQYGENLEESKQAKAKELAKVLEVLKFIKNVKALALINDEGQLITMISSKEKPNYDPYEIITLTTAALSLGDRTTDQLNLGRLEMMFLKAKKGMLAFIGAGPHLVIVLVFNAQADLKNLFGDDLVVIERIKQAIAENYP